MVHKPTCALNCGCRCGKESFPQRAEKTASSIKFHGGSFITGYTGEIIHQVAAQIPRSMASSCVDDMPTLVTLCSARQFHKSRCNNHNPVHLMLVSCVRSWARTRMIRIPRCSRRMRRALSLQSSTSTRLQRRDIGTSCLGIHNVDMRRQL